MADKQIDIKVQVDSNLPQAEEKFVSLKRQIRETTVELQKLAEEGQAGGEKFAKGTTKLAELRSELDQVNNKTQGLFTTFSLLGGEFSEFGEKAETGVSALKTLSSFTFQDIKNQFSTLVTEVSGFVGKIADATGITKIYTITNEALSKSFVAVGVGEEAAAVGAKALSAALVATGIGALVVGLGFAYNALKELVTGEEKAAEATKEFNSELEKQKTLLDLDADSAKRRGNEYIAYLKSIGASTTEIAKVQRQNLTEQTNLTQEALIKTNEEYNKVLKRNDANSLTDLEKITKTKADLEKKLAEQQSELKIKGYDETTAINKKISDDNDKAAKKAEADAKKYEEERKTLRKKIAEEDEKAYESGLVEREKERRSIEKHFSDLIDDAKKHGLSTISLENDMRLALKISKDKFDEKEEKERRERAIKDIDDEIKTISVLTQDGLDKVNKLRQDKQKELLTNTKLTEKERQNIINETNIEILADQKKFEDKKEKDRKEAEAKALKAATDVIDADIRLEQSKQKRLDNLTHAFFESQRKVEDDNYKKKLLAAKGNADAIAIIEEEHANNMLQIDINEVTARTKLYVQYFDQTIKLAQGLQAIAEGDKETQKFAIRVQEAATIGKIVLEDLSAIRKAYNASPITFGLPWSAFYAADAIIGTITANQTANNAISKLDSQGAPPPINDTKQSSTLSAPAPITVQGHATGGYIDGPGTSKSDSIPAYLSKGEYVMNANSTRAFAPLLNTLNEYGNTPRANFAMGGVASASDMQSQSLISAINDNLSRPIKTYVTAQDMSNQQQFHRTIKSRSLI